MKTVKLRNLDIGAGEPKVIVPIVAATRAAILAKAEELKQIPLDIIEWRVDFYQDVFNPASVVETLRQLREVVGEIAILFTFRTKKEGGELDIDMAAYTQLNNAVAQSGYADAVDVEIFSGDETVNENIRNIHEAGLVVVGSNHDFHKTPRHSDLIYRLRKMQDMGADIPKIAVMPQNEEDVLTLLSATLEMKTQYADRPIVTMSMSATGVVTRLCGEVFGSAMTFGAVGQVSAPGQIPVHDLNGVLQVLHGAL